MIKNTIILHVIKEYVIKIQNPCIYVSPKSLNPLIKINEKLNFWKEAGAHHRIRTALWVSGQYERIVGMEMTNLE
jgi:hypothetical protein